MSDGLLNEKNQLVLQLELARHAPTRRKAIEQIANRIATIEILRALEFVRRDRHDDAAVSYASAASVFADARREHESRRLFNIAAQVTTSGSFRMWAANESLRLATLRSPAEVFRSVVPNIESNVQLRIPQVEAYCAVTSHFSEHDDHAIVQLPVGCGKTGVMSILPFGNARGRALAIAPNLEIRKNLAAAFDYSSPKSFLRRTKVLSNGEGPTCAILDDKASPRDCDKSDFVVTNIQQLVSAKSRSWLSRFPPDYFDMIFIDEGHHNVAPSWQRAIQHFASARVVSFTATPLRADGLPVEGKRVYRFPIRDAIRRGYVRDLAAWKLEPSELYFQYQGSTSRHSLEDVLKLRENNWFSRGVALSPECNRSIVNASIQCLETLRSGGSANHQIIAAACSIDHAKQIRSLYEERGLRAEVIHSDLKDDEQESVRAKVRAGDVDVVVHVQMFGEGADYPTLGVAALFRPYRHLVPYIQFIGRIMRVTREAEPGHPDNRGFVVSHVGLNVDRWWQELKQLDSDDGEYFGAIASGSQAFVEASTDPSAPTSVDIRRRFKPEMEVLHEIIDRYVQEGFLGTDREAWIDDIVKSLELRGVRLDALGISRADLAKRLIDRERSPAEVTGDITLFPVQPQRARIEARRRLDERVKAGAKRLLTELSLATPARDLVQVFKISASNNIAAAIILLNLEVQAYLGVGDGERSDLDTVEMQRAHDAMDQLVDLIAARFRKARPPASG